MSFFESSVFFHAKAVANLPETFKVILICDFWIKMKKVCLFCGQTQAEHATIAFVLSRRTHRRDVLGAVFISRVRRTDAGTPPSGGVLCL